ncbi:MAG: glycosyltransferase family 2 protein [Planctomycetes bacterium]|nr:glycosyltransferase family 2 protein [Planctomycetota bacterium]
MKVFVQIPCHNEEASLADVIREIPREIEGVDEVKVLIIDDGSSDNTVQVAKNSGVDFIVFNDQQQGLAKSFVRGLHACLHLGADIVVNTDGDNQYQGAFISDLVQPILKNQADLVIGSRDITNHQEFSPLKKFLQKLGSQLVSHITKIKIHDATSGFRAIRKQVAYQLHVLNNFSYTLETLIQVAHLGSRIKGVPIQVNPKRRESRLFRSIPDFIMRQVLVLLKVLLFYSPARFFSFLAGFSFIISLILSSRIIYYVYFATETVQKIKTGSGFALTFFATATVIFLMAGFLGSILSGLRFLLIEQLNRIKQMEWKMKINPIDLNIWQKDKEEGLQ